MSGCDGNNKIVYDSTTKKPVKEKIKMQDAEFGGRPQPLYFPHDHPTHPGLFKGMAQLLVERGYTNAPSLRAECPKFKCKAGATDCCCRRLLYSEPDFVNVESLLEKRCRERGFSVLFLPKFHPELNPIEQCWGFAKRIYRMYPKSSTEAELETNVKTALAEVKTEHIRR